MSIIRQFRDNNKILIRDLKPKRDFIYIRDLCELIKNIIDKNTQNHIFNAGSGKSYTIKEVIDLVQSLNKYNVPVEVLGHERRNEIHETQADISKAKELLGWEPKWSLKDGISEILDLISQ